MHSSISNSNSRIPRSEYKKIWLLTVTLLSILFILSDFYWRKTNFFPSITDTMMYWAINRNKVYDVDNKKTVVIVGSSRAQLGIVPKTIENELNGKRAIHLAINGTPSLYVLKDLSDDPDFNGIVLFDTTAAQLNPTFFLDAKPWVDFYHAKFDDNFTEVSEKINSFIQVELQKHFTVLSSELTLKRILYSSLSPKPLYLNMQTNRYMPAYYYNRMKPEELKQHKESRITLVNEYSKLKPLNENTFNAELSGKLITYYTKLKNRGGNLFIVRMPSTDEDWSSNQKIYPKDRYWDQIEKITKIPTIHFKDYESLSNFDCPDSSHLDAKDSPAFTKALVDIVKSKIGTP